MRMNREIGNIVLDYSFYNGQDSYTDGMIEDEILEEVRMDRHRQLLRDSTKWPVLYHLSDIRENILEWFPFSDDAKVLEIGSGCGALTGLLSRKAKEVVCIELSEKRSLINAYRNQKCKNVRIIVGNFQDIRINEKFDYITLIGVWEYAASYIDSSSPYLEMIKRIKRYLKKDGKILIAIENKTGMKYWNGAPEDHTGYLYSGLNDYVDNSSVRTFSKREIEQILNQADIHDYNFYYPMPDYKLPDVIYSDRMLPLPGMERNYGKDYSASRVYNFNDAAVFDQIASDGMFPYFANSYLIVTGENGVKECYERYNRLRREQYRVKTSILEDGGKRYSSKKALSKLALQHVIKLKDNETKWMGCLENLTCLEGKIEGQAYISPYIEGVDLDVIFYNYRNNADLFIENYCYYKEKYLKPLDNKLIPFCVSDEFLHVFGNRYPSSQKSLKCTNIDLIFSNLRLSPDGRLYCFDYEWVFDFLIPYEYVIWRSAAQLYDKYRIYLKNVISKNEFLKRAGISHTNFIFYENMEANFYNYVYGNENYLKNYKNKSLIQQIRFV